MILEGMIREVFNNAISFLKCYSYQYSFIKYSL
jgi:hypothetical protein